MIKLNKTEKKYNLGEYIYRVYPDEQILSDEEIKEFKQLLRDQPKLKKSYSDFKMESAQKLRSRIGQSPYLSKELYKLF